MKKQICYFTLALALFAVISFFNFHFNDRMAEIFFAICGVLFSVGMSQIISFDYSKVINAESYANYTKGLAGIRLSFIVQFAIASVSFIIFQVIKSENDFSSSLLLKGRRFSVETFLSLIIVYSLFFFLYNFHLLSKEKTKLDKTIREEMLDEQEG